MKKLLAAMLMVLLLTVASHADESVVVFDGSYKLVESSAGYVHWAWRATVSNRTDVAQDVSLKVQLLDSSGFELDKRMERVHIGPVKVGTFTGTGMMKKDLWEKVSGASFTTE